MMGANGDSGGDRPDPCRERRVALNWGRGATQTGGRAGGFRCGIWICFHPNSRASIDQAPGPSKASARATLPSSSACRASVVWAKPCKIASIAASTPATGVHSPTRRSSPKTPDRTPSSTAPTPPARVSARMAGISKFVPNTTRRSRSPAPGAPFANVEKSRRTSEKGYAANVSAESPERS